MNLSKETSSFIVDTIKNSIRQKLKTYKPETKEMPFHYRLLGKDRMALFSFIHSLNTTFGISIFEPVAQALASSKFIKAEKQYPVGDKISEKAQNEIQHIINSLSKGISVNKNKEIERIREVASIGKMNEIKTVKADLFLIAKNNSIFLFDLKTAKPNISNFKDFKRTLLEWVAIYLVNNPDSDINSLIAIPYNPYYPKPYERWTMKGMIDIEKELLVADEFWDFLGGYGSYNEVLTCFEKAGIELHDEIDEYFLKYKIIS